MTFKEAMSTGKFDEEITPEEVERIYDEPQEVEPEDKLTQSLGDLLEGAFGKRR